jgi:hypothetical protein
MFAYRDYHAFGAPGRIESHAPMTYVIHLDKCTTVAKSLHTESITYKAKFRYLCKTLQGNVPHFWYQEEFWRKKKFRRISLKLLKIKGKISHTGLIKFSADNCSMADKLHLF